MPSQLVVNGIEIPDLIVAKSFGFFESTLRNRSRSGILHLGALKRLPLCGFTISGLDCSMSL
jgi:hypothetical protein